jgi:hypothetical protein
VGRYGSVALLRVGVDCERPATVDHVLELVRKSEPAPARHLPMQTNTIQHASLFQHRSRSKHLYHPM